MNISENIAKLKAFADELLLKAQTRKEVVEAKIKLLGKSGEITALLRMMKELPPEQRPETGKLINDLRVDIEGVISRTEAQLKENERIEGFKKEAIDITLPGSGVKPGGLHPVSLVIDEVVDAFLGMGFELFTGPEIESDFINFQQLNIPKDHPARDMQDTFYITDNILLRTHTSPGQVRCMQQKKPPLKILCPGKVYRSDDDATHSPIFHQIEGLVVDEGVSLCDLKGLLDTVVKKIYTAETKTRLRPSYFPFTEPSVEIDVTCSECGGKGCRLCKGTGWIEILGAGMVNNRVLENCGVDSSKYTGFAFGLGIERMAMIKYGIPDMRLLFDNDVRFLKQFR